MEDEGYLQFGWPTVLPGVLPHELKDSALLIRRDCRVHPVRSEDAFFLCDVGVPHLGQPGRNAADAGQWLCRLRTTLRLVYRGLQFVKQGRNLSVLGNQQVPGRFGYLLPEVGKEHVIFGQVVGMSQGDESPRIADKAGAKRCVGKALLRKGPAVIVGYFETPGDDSVNRDQGSRKT